VRYFARKTTTDLVIRDQVIAAGEWVMLLYASANRDEEVFGADADEFRIDRTPRPHLAFGHGTHFCLGARLARVEGQIVFEELLERFASWELAGEPVPVYGAELNGLKHLPVRFS
jgi:cytochrome P450